MEKTAFGLVVFRTGVQEYEWDYDNLLNEHLFTKIFLKL